MTDFIQFQVPDSGGDGMVNAILRAHSRHQVVRSLRLSWVHVLAVLGGLMALTIAFPGAASDWLRANLALAWALCSASAAGTAVLEWAWYRRRKRLLDANQSMVDGRDAGP